MIEISSAPADGARGKTGLLDVMSTREEHILRILNEAYREIESNPACSRSEVMTRLQSLAKEVAS